MFGEQATIHDVVEHQRVEAMKALDAVPPEDLLNRQFEDLCTTLEQQFRLDIPILDRGRTVELPKQEVDIDVSHDFSRAIRDRSRPFYLKGTAFRIAVPFSGEAVLLKYGTSPFNSPVPGEVEGDRIVLTHQALELNAEVIRRDFDNRMSRIEDTLRMAGEVAEGWNRQLPELVRTRLEQRRGKLLRDQEVSLGYPQAPSTPQSARTAVPPPVAAAPQRYDLFLSHASEDKNDIARPLYEALRTRGVTVWFDEAVLELGDSLRRKIDEGLRICRFGLVILSPNFFAKQWPQRELDGLVARETASGEKAILPVWHRLERDAVLQYSGTLADRVAAKSSDGLPAIVAKILRVLGR